MGRSETVDTDVTTYNWTAGYTRIYAREWHVVYNAAYHRARITGHRMRVHRTLVGRQSDGALMDTWVAEPIE